jgi:DUF4097 and DUF4098 domain-containing protein YvlB
MMILRLFIPLLIVSAVGAGFPAEGRMRPPTAQGDVKLTRSSRVNVQNPNGSITITGGNSDTLHVVARSEDSGEQAIADVSSGDTSGTVEVRPGRDSGGSVDLSIQLPSYVSLPSVTAGSGDVTISGITGDIRVKCGSGNVRVANGGNVYVRADSGDIVVEGAAGTAYLEASSGDVRATGVKGDLTFKAGSGDALVENVGGIVDATLASGSLGLHKAVGNVRVAAISGDVELDGAGSVQIQSASGNITLAGVTGDCDVRTASGNVSFVGEISADHTYKLRSQSGDAVMELCGEVPGFTVTMRSYSGGIETDFPLKVDTPGMLSRGLTGRYLDGRTQIQIEAFSGSAKILKCQRSSTQKPKGKK